MKLLLNFLLVLFSINAIAQGMNERFVMVGQFSTASTLNDSTFRVDVSFPSSQIGAFLPTMIAVDDEVVDGNSRRYRISNIVSASFSTATIDVVEKDDLNLAPQLVGVVYRPIVNDLIPVGQTGTSGITTALFARIINHMQVIVDTMSVDSDADLQFTGTTGTVELDAGAQGVYFSQRAGILLEHSSDTLYIAVDTSFVATQSDVFGAVDSIAVLQDSIVVGYSKGIEVTRDTIRFPVLDIADIPGLADSLAAAPSGSGTTGQYARWVSPNQLSGGNIIHQSYGASITGTALGLPSVAAISLPAPFAGAIAYDNTNVAHRFSTASTWRTPAWSATTNGLFTANRIPYAAATGLDQNSNFILSFEQAATIPNLLLGNTTSRGRITVRQLTTSGTYRAAIWAGNSDYRVLNTVYESPTSGGSFAGSNAPYGHPAAIFANGNFNTIDIPRIHNSTYGFIGAVSAAAIGGDTLFDRTGVGHYGHVGVTGSQGFHQMATGLVGVSSNLTTGSSGNNSGIRYTGVLGRAEGRYGNNVRAQGYVGVHGEANVSGNQIGYGGYFTGIGNQYGVFSNTGINVFRRRTIIGSDSTPTDTLHVAGTLRVTGSSTADAASIAARDVNGVFRNITIGAGLNFSSNTLSASSLRYAQLSFTSYSSIVIPDNVSNGLTLMFSNTLSNNTHTDTTLVIPETGIYEIEFDVHYFWDDPAGSDNLFGAAVKKNDILENLSLRSQTKKTDGSVGTAVQVLNGKYMANFTAGDILKLQVFGDGEHDITPLRGLFIYKKVN